MSDTLAKHERAINNLIHTIHAQQQQIDDLKSMLETLYQAGMQLEHRIANLEAAMTPLPKDKMN